VHDAVLLQAYALNAAREVERPRYGVGIVAADPFDGCPLRVGQVGIPAELLEHAVGELGIAVADIGTDRVGPVGQQRDAVALDTEAGAERPAAVHDVQVGVVERVGAGMLELRGAPARPRQVRSNRPWPDPTMPAT
jgi:hypothetical protein